MSILGQTLKPLSKEVIAPKGRWSQMIKKGDFLKLVDLEGQQAVDFLCYSASLPIDRLNLPNTVKLNKSLYIKSGDVIYSDLAKKMFTVVEDTCGLHDTLAGCCSCEIDFVRYGVKKTESCRTNFIAELSKWTLGPSEIVSNINFFMRVTVGSQGELEIVPSHSKPGDHVLLRAEMDVIAMISNCPQESNPAAGFKPTAVEVSVWEN